MSNPFDTSGYENPFADSGPAAPPPAYAAPAPVSPAPQPAYAAPAQTSYGGPSSYAAPASGASGEYRDPVTGIRLTAKDLELREQELAKRESRIRDVEERLARGERVGAEFPKNFPPLLRIWSYYPEKDIDDAARGALQKTFYVFCANVVVLLLNAIGCLATLNKDASEAGGDSPTTRIVLSIIYFVVFSGLSFEFVYFVLYNAIAAATASGIRYVGGMATYTIWILFLAFLALGLKMGGSVGFIISFEIIGKASSVGAIGLVYSFAQAGVIACSVISFIWFARYFKQRGIAAQAGGEAAQMGADFAREHPQQAQQLAAGAAGAAYQ